MTDFMEILKGRRSIRRYEERDIPEVVLNQLLESVQWSPSWANTQCWEIVVVRDRETKEHLKETLPPTNPGSKAVVQAPVVFAVCGKIMSSGYKKGQVTTKFGDWFMYDLGIATQSICLAAYAQGLGTVVIGLMDHDKAKGVLEVPDGYELVSLIPLGYPAKESPAPKRRAIGEFTHKGKF
jgi:nitroreductase